ncbi:MAG: competence/damage-inducible protein A [Chloroflexi bacterium]|nr:competence/damage-inducible protein A [Chloroflexota bacterium]
MKAEIVSIGTELLMGQIVDTNAAYLAGQLPALGVDLYFISQVGDNIGRISDVLSRALARSDLVLTTGGLGPTEDDVTREAIAQALGERMEVRPELERPLRDFFRRRGMEMPERNVKQATLIPSAKAIPNPKGTAPGWWVEKNGRIIAAMPGPPREMTYMWENEVTPRLRRLTGEVTILSRLIKTFGIGEGKVDEMLSPLLKSPNPSIGVYAKPDGIHLRVTAKAAMQRDAEALLLPMVEKVLATMGETVWGFDNATLETSVGQALRARRLTLATMESCTGGLLASAITDVPGSSDYYKGGVISYANEVKAMSGVDSQLIALHGAVSEPVARAMAAAVRQCYQADIGVGITGVAGPSEMEGKPPGTVYTAIDDGHECRAFHTFWPGDRLAVKRRATTHALFQMKKLLEGRA